MFENAPVTLACPSGNSSGQKWTRVTDEYGKRMNVLLTNERKPSEYHIDHATYKHEGQYECSEDNHVLLTISLETEGIYA